MQKISVNVMFTHIISKKGIKRNGEKAIAETFKEYTQLEYMKVMGELEPGSLKKSQKRGALSAINLIKEKDLEN